MADQSGPWCCPPAGALAGMSGQLWEERPAVLPSASSPALPPSCPAWWPVWPAAGWRRPAWRPPVRPSVPLQAGGKTGKNPAGNFRGGILRARSNILIACIYIPPFPPNGRFSQLEILGAKKSGPRRPALFVSWFILHPRRARPPPGRRSGAPVAAPGIGRHTPAIDR